MKLDASIIEIVRVLAPWITILIFMLVLLFRSEICRALVEFLTNLSHSDK
jgi:hypothetical protein